MNWRKVNRHLYPLPVTKAHWRPQKGCDLNNMHSTRIWTYCIGLHTLQSKVKGHLSGQRQCFWWTKGYDIGVTSTQKEYQPGLIRVLVVAWLFISSESLKLWSNWDYKICQHSVRPSVRQHYIFFRWHKISSQELCSSFLRPGNLWLQTAE